MKFIADSLPAGKGHHVHRVRLAKTETEFPCESQKRSGVDIFELLGSEMKRDTTFLRRSVPSYGAETQWKRVYAARFYRFASKTKVRKSGGHREGKRKRRIAMQSRFTRCYDPTTKQRNRSRNLGWVKPRNLEFGPRKCVQEFS